MFLALEFITLAVGLTALDQALGSVIAGPGIGIATFLAVLFVVDVFVSNALVVNQFLASNVRAILEIQLASLVVLITVVSIEVYRSAHSVGAGIGCFLGLSVVGAGIMWFWSWFQAHMLVSDMNSEQGSGAKPAFFTQLGFQPGQGHYAVDASANHILRVVYGPTAWLLALAGCVTTVAVKAGMAMLRRD